MKKNDRGEALKGLLSRNIKLFRVDSGLSQAELAEKAGISTPYLGTVERGDKWPSPATLAEIAFSMGIEPYDLFRPESVHSREVKKIIAKLARDISTFAANRQNC
jgi:transcriptional regulator with XRE-family HTH domain